MLLNYIEWYHLDLNFDIEAMISTPHLLLSIGFQPISGLYTIQSFDCSLTLVWKGTKDWTASLEICFTLWNLKSRALPTLLSLIFHTSNSLSEWNAISATIKVNLASRISQDSILFSKYQCNEKFEKQRKIHKRQWVEDILSRFKQDLKCIKALSNILIFFWCQRWILCQKRRSETGFMWWSKF